MKWEFLSVLYISIILLAISKYSTSMGRLMLMLMSLESLMIFNSLSFMYVLNDDGVSMIYILLYFLCNVMEACVGLSLVVLVSRGENKEMCKL